MAFRPHFKVHTSVRTHRKFAELYDDNDAMATWTRLGIHAVEAFAGATDGRFLLRRPTLIELAGAESVEEAAATFQRLAAAKLLTFRQASPTTWEIRWPKFVKKQGFDGKTQRVSSSNADVETRVSSPNSLDPTPTPTPTPKSNSEEEKSKSARGRAAPSKLAFPSEASEVEHLRSGLLLWAADPDAKHPGYRPSQIDFALRAIADKSAARGYLNANWLQACQGYIRNGWPLVGFGVGPNGQTLSKSEARIVKNLEGLDRLNPDSPNYRGRNHAELPTADDRGRDLPARKAFHLAVRAGGSGTT